jgi:ubiquinone biosynthesis protein
MISEKLTGFDFAHATAAIGRLAENMTAEEMTAHLWPHVQKVGIEGFREGAVKELVALTRPEDAIPDRYQAYRLLVRDGITFLLANLSPRRLLRLAVDQMRMPDATGIEGRLVKLAGQIPTLHKLGQILARNRYVDPVFKKWLIRLENGAGETPVEVVLNKVQRELNGAGALHSVELDEVILSEASVGVVVGFTWTARDADQKGRGVFKVLKPGVKEKLQEEFGILEKLAEFFIQNKGNYPLKEFLFIETFQDIREALEKELELQGEQAHLEWAARFYDDERLIIPRILPLCTDHMTAMTFIEGDKITDIAMTPEQRKNSARALFRGLIWRPLLSLEEMAIFHGDPHAGNIFAAEDDPRTVLLDWSMAGYLSKKQRLDIIRLVQGILLDDQDSICKSVQDLTEIDRNRAGDQCEHLAQTVSDVFNEPEYVHGHLLYKAFYLVDRLAVRGLRFPKDLLLFRKSFFTVDGILHDLDPTFEIDDYLTLLIKELVEEELPKRIAYFAFPYLDRSLNYKSTLSNADLQLFIFRFLVKFLEQKISILTQSAGELAMSALRPLELLVWSSQTIPIGGVQWMPSSTFSFPRDKYD